MSPSSSGSWSGGRGADIIDLDRYMRGAVRPSRPISERSNCCPPELVVDGGAGGVNVKPTADARHKRYSHDSGVSDSSYSRRRRISRSHRRLSNIDGSRVRPSVDPTSMRIQDSSDSLRQFRAVCEQALLEQQRQIAHVAQLCEKLTERAAKTERGDLAKERNESNETQHKDGRNSSQREQNIGKSDEDRTAKGPPLHSKSYIVKSDRPQHRRERMSSDMSDTTSTSRSTRDPRRKDKHRTQQCKTYKIIMSKLDELNRLFSSRPLATPRAARSPRFLPSSSSVTVCDKLVATDPPRPLDKIIMPSVKPRRMSTSPTSCSRRVTHAYAVDIAPGQAKPNVVMESVVKTSERGSATSVGDPRCGFDLDDPVHAKKLQTMTLTSTRRGRSVEMTSRPSSADADTRHDTRPESRRARHGSPTLCGVCRDYWRYLRQCLVPHMFSPPDHCQC